MLSRTTLLSVAVAAAALTGAVCAAWAGAGSQAGPAVVSIAVDHTGIHAPTTIRPGVTTFEVSSSTTGKTQSILLARLNAGTTYSQIRQAMASGNPGAIFAHVTGEGGIAEAGPHNGGRWTVDVSAGSYLLVDDEAGLAAPLAVAGKKQSGASPAAKGTVTFAGGTFRLPRTFGDGTWRVTNRDRIQHELGLIAIPDGHTQAEVEHALATGRPPAWVKPAGTLNLVGPGQTVWFSLSQIHGLYLLVDYLPAMQGAAKAPVVQFRDFR